MISTISAVLQRNPATSSMPARQLRLLVLASEATPGVTVRATAKEMGAPRPAMTRCANSLAAAGLMVRRKDTADNRSVWLCITPSGRKLLGMLNAEIAKGMRAAEKRLAFAAE